MAFAKAAQAPLKLMDFLASGFDGKLLIWIMALMADWKSDIRTHWFNKILFTKKNLYDLLFLYMRSQILQVFQHCLDWICICFWIPLSANYTNLMFNVLSNCCIFCKCLQLLKKISRVLYNIVVLFVPWEMRIKKIES